MNTQKIWILFALFGMHTYVCPAADEASRDEQSVDTRSRVKLLSYNICTEGRTFDTPLDLQHRLPAIIKIIKTQNPDIVCLQEVRSKVAESVATSLRGCGYEPLYTPNNDGPMSLGLMTAYRPERFSSERHIPQWFSETPNESSGNEWYRFGRVYTLVELHKKQLSSGRTVHEPLWVINTHLGLVEEEKEYSAQKLLAAMACLKRVVLVGDMNFFDDKRGQIQRGMYTGAGMQDLLANAQPTFVGYSYDSFIPKTKADMSKLDGAFVKGVEGASATVLLYDELADDLSNRDEQPSDHLPLTIEF